MTDHHSNLGPTDLQIGSDPAFASFVLSDHVFLSHIWSSAQDQVAVIKRQLLLLVPGISVFLDVLLSMCKGASEPQYTAYAPRGCLS